MDLKAAANESVSKRNTTLPGCADEISQNLEKQELFFSHLNNHHNKLHLAMFYRKQQFDSPLPTFVPLLHQAMWNDYGRRINKMILPPPTPSLSRPQQTKFRVGTPAHC